VRKSLLTDAFEHHQWATLRLLDACLDLSLAQLATDVPGTFGSIFDTLRHLVGADASYLAVLSDGRSAAIDEEAMDVRELRTAMERLGPAWASLLGEDPDPDYVVVRRRDDGSEGRAPLGIRLAQALHHGTDHRSQVCTALTTLGLEPPEIDVWAFAEAYGRLGEVPPTV
jgi:uncharacterized damage-inducible protein DinB